MGRTGEWGEKGRVGGEEKGKGGGEGERRRGEVGAEGGCELGESTLMPGPNELMRLSLIFLPNKYPPNDSAEYQTKLPYTAA